jgi:hypothetical protein
VLLPSPAPKKNQKVSLTDFLNDECESTRPDCEERTECLWLVLQARSCTCQEAPRIAEVDRGHARRSDARAARWRSGIGGVLALGTGSPIYHFLGGR